MAYTRCQNQTPAAHGNAWNNLSTMLMGAGWTQLYNMDGATGTINANPAVDGVAVATWTNNQYTGAVYLSPDGKMLALSRPTSAAPQNARVTYSKAAGFRDGLVKTPTVANITNAQTIAFNDGQGLGDSTTTLTWWKSGGDPGGNSIDIRAVTTAAETRTAILAKLATLTTRFTWVASTSATDEFYAVKTVRTGIITITTANVNTIFAPGATKPPVAYADQKLVWGGGTDTAPTGVLFWPTTAGSYRQNGSANGAAPYHFWMATATSATGALSLAFALDTVTGAPTGEWDDGVLHVATTTPWTTAILTEAAQLSGGAQAWVGKVATAGWGAVHALMWATNNGGANLTTMPGGMPASTVDSKDETDPVIWFRRPAGLYGNPGPYGRHGESTLMQMQGTARSTWDLVTSAAAGDRVYLGYVSVAGWDNTAITV